MVQANTAFNFMGSDGIVDPRTGNVSYSFPILDHFTANDLSGPDISFKLMYANTNQGLPSAYGANWQDNFTVYDKDKQTMYLYTGQTLDVTEYGDRIEVVDDSHVNLTIVKVGENEIYIKYAGGRIEKLSNPINGESSIKLTTNIFSEINAEVAIYWVKKEAVSGHALETYRVNKILQRKGNNFSNGNYQTIVEMTPGLGDDYTYTVFPNTEQSHSFRISINQKNLTQITSSYPKNSWEYLTWKFKYVEKVYTDSGSPYLNLPLYTSMERITSAIGNTDSFTYDSALTPTPGYSSSSFPRVVGHQRMTIGAEMEWHRSFHYSANNYLGYAGSIESSASEQANKNYSYYINIPYEYYTVETQSEYYPQTGAGNTTKIIKRTYNKFHQEIRQELSQNEGDNDNIVMITSYNTDDSKTYPEQTKNFFALQKKETQWTKNGQIRTELVENQMDADGNVIQEKMADGTTIDYDYYSTSELPSNDGKTRYLKTVTTRFSDSTPTRRETTSYALILSYQNTSGLSMNSFYRIPSTIDYEEYDVTSSTYVKLKSHEYGYLSDENSPFNGAVVSEKVTHFNPKTNESSTTTLTSSWTDEASRSGYKVTTTVKGDITTTIYHKIHGQIIEETDPIGNHTTYTYNKFGELVQTDLAMPGQPIQTEKIEYQPESRLMTIMEPSGISTRSYLDGAGREIRRDEYGVDGQYYTVGEYAYNTEGLKIKEKKYWLDENNHLQENETIYTADFWGGYSKIQYPTGVEQRFERSFVTQGNLMTVENEYYAASGVIVSTIPKTRAIIDITGKVIEASAYDHQTLIWQKTQIKYDKLGRENERIGPDQAISKTKYDSFGHIQEIIRPDGSSVKYDYDLSGAEMPKKITVNGTVIGENQLDDYGRSTNQTVGGLTTSFEYLGLRTEPMAETRPDGKRHTFDYHYGVITAVQGFKTNTGTTNIEKTRTFDSRFGSIGSDKITYNEDGRTVTQFYSYDDIGRQISTEINKVGFPANVMNSTREAYTYPKLGTDRILTSTNAEGQTKTYGYDSFGRVRTINFNYENQMAMIVNHYDENNRLILEEFLLRTLHKETRTEYDGMSRVKKKQVQASIGGINRYTEITELTYDKNNKVLTKNITKMHRIPNSPFLTTSENNIYSYDSNGRLKKHEISCVGENLYPLDTTSSAYKVADYSWDYLDRLTSIGLTRLDNTRSSLTYSYKTDKIFQINQIIRDGGLTYKVNYDANGAIIGQNYTYDDEGQLKSTGSSKYIYDARNRLAAVLKENGTVPAYAPTYSGNVRSVINHSTGANDRAASVYFKGNGEEVFLSKTGHLGELKTVLEAVINTDETNTIRSESLLAGDEPIQFTDKVYSAFGKTTASVEFTPGLKGQILGDGLYFQGNGHRAYSPDICQFLTPDPYAVFGGGGINPYTFCMGDPINLEDPTGYLSAWAWFYIGLGVAALILAAPVAIGLGIAGAGIAGALAGASLVVGGGYMINAGLQYDRNPSAATQSVIAGTMAIGEAGGAVIEHAALGSNIRRQATSKAYMVTLGDRAEAGTSFGSRLTGPGTLIDLSRFSQSPLHLRRAATSFYRAELISVNPRNRMIFMGKPSEMSRGKTLITVGHGKAPGENFVARYGGVSHGPSYDPKNGPAGSVAARYVGDVIRQYVPDWDSYSEILLYGCHTAEGGERSVAYAVAHALHKATIGFDGSVNTYDDDVMRLLNKSFTSDKVSYNPATDFAPLQEFIKQQYKDFAGGTDTEGISARLFTATD